MPEPQQSSSPMPAPEKSFPVSWDQFHRDSRALAWRLNGAGPFETVLKQAAPSIVALGGGKGMGVLIVDDLVDTGQTAKIVRAQLPRAHFATVYAKPMGRPLVDTFVTGG